MSSKPAGGGLSVRGYSPATALSTLDELMAYAYAMETEAAERYAEFAEIMESHNNPEVAELFAKMARIEGLHAQQIRDTMGWTAIAQPRGSYAWEGLEGAETGDHSDLHYLMTPHHALTVARLNEERALRFYQALADAAGTDAVRAAAEEMRGEEEEHVRLIDAWLARTPAPEDDWALDLDPPNHHD